MPKNHTLRLLLLFLFAFSIVTTVGCRGCRDDQAKTAEEKKKEEDEKKKEQEEKDKPSFEAEAAVVYPGQYEDATRRNRTKRGHWITADYRLTANKFDAQGNITAHSSALNTPVNIENTDYYSVSSRPFTIAKGEQKNLSTNVYIPRRDKGSSTFITFNLQRNSGVTVPDFHGVPLMMPYQYHIVVLTKEADKYGYFNVIDSVSIPYNQDSVSKVPNFYTIVRTRPDIEPISLPRQSLYWTTIAYVVWDDLDVDQLDADQQQALVDWIHFGGQLILSGPDSLDQLANSFLADYLPATIKSSRNLNAQDFESINKHWALKDKNLNQDRKIILDDGSPIIGVDFDVHPAANFVTNTGKIAVERQVGRGRIVATAFSLKSKPIINWRSYQSFFNAAILRRPARKFGETVDNTSLAFSWIDDATSIFDPLIGSTLRYLSRDLVQSVQSQAGQQNGTPPSAEVTPKMVLGFALVNSNYPSSEDDLFRTKTAPSKQVRNLDDHWHYGGFTHDQQSGAAGWNDESGISAAARETLRQAAGISPPSSAFVLKMLSIYLLVLVPINWLIFRSMGRVEWAWVAAPVIAIAGALMVAKMASLDIGFVRSNTQVACLEVYADYPRAHVAQYSALYTSLSTGYELELDNPSAQSLPLGEPYKKWKEKGISPVTMRQTIKNRLEGFQVQSNSTGMLHTEMMLDLNGIFSMVQKDGQVRIDNLTPINIDQAAVLRRNEEGVLQAAWLGKLEATTYSENLIFENIKSMGDPWENSLTLKTRWMSEELWERYEPAIEVLDDGTAKVDIGSIRELTPELQEQWPDFVMLANRLPTVREFDAVETIEERKIGFDQFKQILRQLNQFEELNVSAMFQQVINNLTLAKGEVRMIAVTNEPLGKNFLKPVSTQTKQQTLVVVHLKRPAFADAIPDVNSIEDFTGNSNLDYLEELESLDESLEEEMGDLEQEEDN